jgi:hypothetical protein
VGFIGHISGLNSRYHFLEYRLISISELKPRGKPSTYAHIATVINVTDASTILDVIISELTQRAKAIHAESATVQEAAEASHVRTNETITNAKFIEIRGKPSVRHVARPGEDYGIFSKYPLQLLGSSKCISLVFVMRENCISENS